MGTHGFNLYILFYLCELVGLLFFMLKLCHISLCSLWGRMGLIYTLFYLCELVGLLVFMLKLCHISLCSLNMGTYGFNLYLVLFM